MKRSFCLGLAGALWCATSFAPPARADMESAKVALPSPIISFAAEYIAEALFYKEQGLAVQSMEIAGIGAMNAVISGSVDFSFSSGGSIDRAAARGQRLLAIATLSNSPGEYGVIRQDIAEAAHFDAKAPVSVRAQILKGHSFGIGGMGTIGDAFLRLFAKEGGVDPKDMVFSALQPPEIMAALKTKSLDGFALGPPWGQQAEHDKVGVIFGSGDYGDLPAYTPSASALLVTRPQLCAQHRSICVKMGHSMVLAVDFMHAHQAEAIAILKKTFGNIEPDVMASAYAGVVSTAAQPPVTTAEQLMNGDKINVDAGFLKREDMLPSYDGLFTTEFLK